VRSDIINPNHIALFVSGIGVVRNIRSGNGLAADPVNLLLVVTILIILLLIAGYYC
jgi:hypothetical protein